MHKIITQSRLLLRGQAEVGDLVRMEMILGYSCSLWDMVRLNEAVDEIVNETEGEIVGAAASIVEQVLVLVAVVPVAVDAAAVVVAEMEVEHSDVRSVVGTTVVAE